MASKKDNSDQIIGAFDPIGVDAFSPSALEERALARWQRISALAERLERAAVKELLDYLGDDHPFVRWEAGRALWHIAQRVMSRSRLGRALRRGGDRDISFTQVLDLLAQQLASPKAERRVAAADAFGLWSHDRATYLLTQALTDEQPMVRASAATSLGRIGDRIAVPALIQCLDDPSLWVRRAAAEALGAIADPQALAKLGHMALEEEDLVAIAAISALGHLPYPRSRQILVECTEHENPTRRWYAARSLGQMGDVSSLPALRRLLPQQETFFERSIGEVARSAIETIERRERGLWNMLRKSFYTLYTGLSHIIYRFSIRSARRRKEAQDDNATARSS
ncbi:MAG: HEAT repeat domain-containing protein [Chloroflexi bacterium]|nr:HEAT repeat domain-containing protein [Chloroflexota bacterium]